MKENYTSQITPETPLASEGIYQVVCGDLKGETPEIINSLAQRILHHANETQGGIPFDQNSQTRLEQLGVDSALASEIISQAAKNKVTCIVVGHNEQPFVGLVSENSVEIRFFPSEENLRD